MTSGLRIHQRRQAGFSLIEMVVALALISVTLAVLPGSIRIAMQAWSSRGEIERAATLDMLMEALEQHIGQIVPLVDRKEDGRLRVEFSGSRAGIEFIAASETGPLGPALYRYRIAAANPEQKTGGLAIEMTSYVARPIGPQSERQSDGGVDLGKDSVFAFRYFGAMRPGEPPSWHEEWQRDDELPLLIEISAEPVNANSRQRRRSVAAPRIALQ